MDFGLERIILTGVEGRRGSRSFIFIPETLKHPISKVMMAQAERSFNGAYAGEYLNRVAFPLGGIGAGMMCLEGAGALSHVSLRHVPNIFHEPMMFSAVFLKTSECRMARLLEGPVPKWKIGAPGAGLGGHNRTYGLPRFASASFEARFPFGRLHLSDPQVPLDVEILGWSPFIPGNADDSSLPVAALEFSFTNRSQEKIEGVYSFHAQNFLRDASIDRLPEGQRPPFGVRPVHQGFALFQDSNQWQPWSAAALLAEAESSDTRVNCRWFRGGWFDPLTVVWKTIADGEMPEADVFKEGNPSSGASLYVPFSVEPGASTLGRLRLCWYVPHTKLRLGTGLDDVARNGEEKPGEIAGSDADQWRRTTYYQPWYAGRFDAIEEVATYWRSQYSRLHRESLSFSECFYDTTLPAEIIEAIAANLTILKSPTVLRQTDGRLWLWEGCADNAGSCHGSCTHVWNYAQALCHLFPQLERTLRETEFNENQDSDGHQAFRAGLPIRPIIHDFYAAADGQLGGILKVYREWRICGDNAWLERLWPRVKQSLEYCISTWDPAREGILKEPHHNTYDIEFWGPNGLSASFYVTALTAAYRMGQALDDPCPEYGDLAQKASSYLEGELFDGEYFIQQICWTGLNAADPTAAGSKSYYAEYSAEAVALLQREGPKYQYGRGCLSDGILGSWMAEACGLKDPVSPEMVRSHVHSVYRYNFRSTLAEHANPQRSTYAQGAEGGLLLCSWPKGGKLTLPFVYSDEVWTGIEYQVASHLMMFGYVEEGLQIVRTLRRRYDGPIRNPFDEFECGHWYGRAQASYALLQGMTGQRYDAIEKTLYLSPKIQGDWRAFISTASGFGTVGVRDGKPFIDVRSGTIDVRRIEMH